MSRIEMPVRKSNTTRRMEQNVRETGFTEKTDLKESLIGHAPSYLVSWQDLKSTPEGALFHMKLTISSCSENCGL
jgi:hypothetical protein